ncbi:MAG TPA: YceI family protein [Candidatus Sulfotelmatobacter sp.]|nr:YceI family protein [Candidatus Sulfotelmatobacter sp.]
MIKRISYFAFIAIVGLLAGRLAMAQSNTAPIDSQYSAARLFLSSSKSPDKEINVGVARVSGNIRWSANDPSQSVFDFTAYPADQGEPALEFDDHEANQEFPTTASYTVIDFKSKRVEPNDDGSFRVTGDLTVTQVERIATYEPSEAYSGPTYGAAVVHSATRDAVFVFRRAQSTDVKAEKLSTGAALWLASSVVSAKELPELLKAVAATDWPVFVEEERCDMPANVGEDYSGPACSTKIVDRVARTDVQCSMPSFVGEDFAGEQCTGAPLQTPTSTTTGSQSVNRHHSSDDPQQLVADEVRLQLELQLGQPNSARLGTSGQ